MRFWQGYDVYDQPRVGFVSDGPEAMRVGTPIDVTQPGNGTVVITGGGTALSYQPNADYQSSLLGSADTPGAHSCVMRTARNPAATSRSS